MHGVTSYAEIFISNDLVEHDHGLTYLRKGFKNSTDEILK